jgi:HemY protein
MLKPIKLFFFLLVAVVLGYFVHAHQGRLVIFYNHTGYETYLWLGVVLLVLLFFITHTLLNMTHATFTFKKRMRKRRVYKRLLKHKNAMEKGMLHQAEGQWKKALQHFKAAQKQAPSSVASSLSVLNAAHLKPEDISLSDELPNEQMTEPQQIGIILAQANLLITQEKWGHANKKVQYCLTLKPKHPFALKLLSQIHHHNKQWDQLKKLIPDLKRSKALSSNMMNKITRDIDYHFLLSAKKDHCDLPQLWKSLNKSSREDGGLIQLYCQQLASSNQLAFALRWLEKKIKRSEDSRLFTLYADLSPNGSLDALLQAERWLKTYHNNASLYQCLGVLSLKNAMLPKAKQYFLKAQKINPSADTLRQLAQLSETNQQFKDAAEYYKQLIALLEIKPIH